MMAGVARPDSQFNFFIIIGVKNVSLMGTVVGMALTEARPLGMVQIHQQPVCMAGSWAI
jgi:hypothetical protein